RAYLKRMYVDKKFRGTGLAKELLETALAFARKNNYSEVYLGTVPEMAAANMFYQKHGFKKIKALPSDFPEFGDTLFYALAL
ncbi:MAG: GNAT family N-acetyltransferase, partial [Candidatus Micrarchaeota archaeon]|nr:GNAT family N-acetyltransferase [Candidatus Micrarchaeota archaeon]